MRKCVLHTQTNLCVNVLEIEDDNYFLPDGYSFAPDDTGEIYWYWDGDSWYDPSKQYLNAYLGQYPIADTPDVTDESDRLATTFYVRQKIEDYINNIFLKSFILDGGTFGDGAPTTIYDAGRFDDTGSNLTADILATLFDNTGGNLTSDIDVGSF